MKKKYITPAIEGLQMEVVNFICTSGRTKSSYELGTQTGGFYEENPIPDDNGNGEGPGETWQKRINKKMNLMGKTHNK